MQETKSNTELIEYKTGEEWHPYYFRTNVDESEKFDNEQELMDYLTCFEDFMDMLRDHEVTKIRYTWGNEVITCTWKTTC